jgi:tripartite-type tricarboxylate transporter receptor subunit TctC
MPKEVHTVKYGLKWLNVTILLVSVVLIAICMGPGYAEEEAAKYPSHPITMIVPLPPGSTADLEFRLISREAEKFLGQPVVMVNKPGAGTTIGVAALAVSKPDGYTIGFTPPTAMLVAPFVEKLPYEPLRDFQQIMQHAEANFGIIVRGDSPFKTFKDLIASARQNPKKLTYGTTGAYSIAHLTMALIAKKDDIQVTHIPFKGGPETQAAILGGHVDFGVSDFNYPLLESGQIRLLALLGEKRRAEYPHVPLLKDLGYDSPDVPPPSIYHNIAGPRGIPEAIATKIEDAFTRATKEPAFLKGMQDMRLPVVYRNSKELTEYMTRVFSFYEKVLGTESSRQLFAK